MEINVRPVGVEELAEEIKQLISENRNVTVTARGNSMNPAFRDRKDKITLSPCDPEKIKRGGVVFCKIADGRFVIHRVIKIVNGTVILSGDGNISITETARIADIIASVTGFTRNGRNRSCNGAGWKAYSAVWSALKPARRYLLRIWRIYEQKNFKL